MVRESFGAAELSGGAGVAVNPGSSVVYAANTSVDVVDAFGLEPVAVPLVVKDYDSEVTATSVRLGAEVNARSLAGEPETEYRFEYGECEGACDTSPYGSSTPTGSIAASFEAAAVGAEVVGLKPGSTYHFRLVATNKVSGEEETQAEGEEVVFSTQTGGGFTLADDRAWEMVSPVQKHGALIEPINQEGVIQAAAGGEAITYHANQAIEEEPAGAMNEVQILSTRTPEGWSSHDIEPPHGTSGKPEGEGEPYRFFSEDLGLAVLQPAGAFEPAVSAEASEQTAFLRSDYVDGDLEEPCLASSHVDCYRPLVTGKEGYANVPLGTSFGEYRGSPPGPCPQATIFCGPLFEGASANAEHVVVSSYAQLTETPVPGEELYEWSNGTLQLISILPEAEGGKPATTRPYLGTEHALNTKGAVSTDGSRVLWQSTGGLYLRDTNPVSSGDPRAQTTTLIGGEYQTANKEITRVFTGGGGGALDEYNVETGETVTIAASAEKVQGAVIGAGEDGSYVYFVADGQLNSAGEGAIHGTCKGVPRPSERCNLYVYHDGTSKLIAVLSGEDGPDWAKTGPNRNLLTARVSPNGEYLAFMSARDLAGYDPTDATTNQPDEEVYLYSAETGRLACASCEPTGARPHGVFYEEGGTGEGQGNMPLVGSNRVWLPVVSLAANIPGWTPYRLLVADYQSRYLSDSGRLFFNSLDPLVPKDTNGNWDVYEYEPQGIGAAAAPCEPAAASGSDVFKPARSYTADGRAGEEGAGCVALISSGSSHDESAFLDASETGGDVFFLTTGKLAPQDTDTAYDVYDAHECTPASPCITTAGASTPPVCESEAACRTALAPESGIYGPAASVLFTGEGNVHPAAKATETFAQKLAKALKTCRKQHPKSRKRRQACERTAHKRYAPKKKTKPNNKK